MKDKRTKKKQKRKSQPYNPYSDMIKLLGGWAVWLWLRPKVHRISADAPKRIKGGVLIAANHTSLWDPIILYCVFWYRRLSFLATKELFEKKINRFFFKNMNCIIVDKESFNMSSIRLVCNRLKADMATVIFPEGGINFSEKKLMEYKHGTVFMAKKVNKPVLPVYIAVRKHWWQRNHVLIGEPVDVAAMCRKYKKSEDVVAVSEYLRKQELELIEYYNTFIKKDGEDC